MCVFLLAALHIRTPHTHTHTHTHHTPAGAIVVYTPLSNQRGPSSRALALPGSGPRTVAAARHMQSQRHNDVAAVDAMRAGGWVEALAEKFLPMLTKSDV
jgi:hypothetical protein